MPRPVALMTGVGRLRGIGAGIARRLAADGWDLALSFWQAYDERMPWGVQPDDVNALVADLAQAGAHVTAHSADLEDASVPAALMASAVEAHGAVSALILCHCESVSSSLMETSVESFDRHFAVNARASFLLVKAFAAQCPPGGRIVALTSDALAGELPYGASKAALDRIILAAAREFGPQRISANLINPGPIDTGWMNEEVRAACLARQPTGRLGTPADIAGLVRFLLSEDGAWINGQLLYADGGFSA